MAQTGRIENLPIDDLREILIHVAKQQKEAFDIARIFTVSKTFQLFSEDKDVLRAVAIVELLPQVALDPEFYAKFSEVGGLIVRCARAGNPKAQFVLAKLILDSASRLSSAKREAGHQDCTHSTENYNLSDADKASRLLHYLSAQNTDPTELLDLVRYFLSRAKIEDFRDMHNHLKDFVAMYLLPVNKPEHQQFLNTLNKLHKKKFLPLLFTAKSLIQYFNGLCEYGYEMMKDMGMDEEVFRSLLQCKVYMHDDDIAIDTLVERFDTIENILMLARDSDGKLPDGYVSMFTKFLKIELENLKEQDTYLQSAREKLIESFDALVNIQRQGSS